MFKTFVIQDVVSGKYWVGGNWSSDPDDHERMLSYRWTEDIWKALWFYKKRYALEYISDINSFDGKVVTIVMLFVDSKKEK